MFTAWLVENGGDVPKYRTWRNGRLGWTSNLFEATWYARKIDAQRAHRHDDGAWRFVEHGFNDKYRDGRRSD